LLTGRVPFEGTDVIAVLHGHLAKSPSPLRDLRPDIPKVVSDLVLKLLAKAAEDRYQSAEGVAADLAECASRLDAGGRIEPFALARKDKSGIFRVSEKLYGRERQVETLLHAFERATAGERQLLLVEGLAGTGKSVLVHEVHKPILATRGYFILGKFELFSRGTPLSALRDALGDLVQQLLGGQEAQLDALKAKILVAVGEEARVLIDFVPQVEHVIGPQPPAVELEGAPARERFDRLLLAFLQAVADTDHPLVLFLDDLQWIDSASLRFLSELVTSQASHHLLVIGAFRNNEVHEGDPLYIALHRIEETGQEVTRVTVEPLGHDDLVALIADTTDRDRSEVALLADLVLQKTGGNPLFATQFLRMLGDEGLLRFCASEGRWTWNIEKLRELDVSDNVVEFMMAKIKQYPEETRHALSRAACLGNTFDLDTMALVTSRAPNDVGRSLWMPIRDGLVLALDAAHEYYLGAIDGAEAPEQPASVRHKFAHDRIREAAASLIETAEIPRINLEIGRRLRDRKSVDEADGSLFALVKHLNTGSSLMTSADERRNLAELNLAAGRRARSATAYEAASDYLAHGIELLGERAWTKDYELMFALERDRLDCEYLAGHTQLADDLFGSLVQQARSPMHIGDLYQLKIRLLQTQHNYQDGVRLGRECLRLFGIDLPSDPESAQSVIAEEGRRISQHLAERDIAYRADDHTLAAPEMEMSMGVLVEVWSSAVMAGDVLQVVLSTMKLVRLSMEHGNCRFSALGYVAYAGVLAMRDDYGSARAFGDVGMKLGRKFDDVFLLPRVNNTYANFTGHIVEHIRELIPVYEASYRASLQCGDRWWGQWALTWIRCVRLLKGDPVSKVLEAALDYHPYIQASNYLPGVWMSQIEIAVLRNLKGETASPRSLDVDQLSEEELHATLVKHEFVTGLYMFYLYKAMLAYLYGDPDAACGFIDRADPLQKQIPRGSPYPDYFFFACLTYANRAREADDKVRATALAVMDAAIDRVGVWRNVCPANFEHRHCLMLAERARVTGDGIEAISLYERAVKAAAAGGFTHHQAIANELLGHFYLETGRDHAALGYMLEAVSLYDRWGAVAKVEQIKRAHADLLRKSTVGFGATSSQSTAASTTPDLETVLKASGALAGEIVLDSLLTTMMRLTIENAGAERGALLLVEDDDLWLESEGTTDTLAVLQHRALESCDQLPKSVVRYVARTREVVLLHNAVAEGRFTKDPYVQSARARSLLALPLVHRGKLVAVLILENNLTSNVFTADRVELLRVLCSQAATAIENARLYATLEQKVNLRTQALREKNEELVDTLHRLEQAQHQLVQSEKMAALGQLIAGVAHEINSPIGAIRAASENIAASLADTVEDMPGLVRSLTGEQARMFLQLVRKGLAKSEVLSSKELRSRRRQLEADLRLRGVESAETIADMLIDAGITADLEDEAPLLVEARGEKILRAVYNLAMLQKNCETIGQAVARVSRVVFALKTFSHPGSADQKTEGRLVEGIENVLTIYSSYLKHGVEVRRRYRADPVIPGYHDALQQVWINLIHNALQAMDNRGTLEIEVGVEGDDVVIRMADSGSGIPEQIGGRIFEAFYTTKSPGEGTGLGLHICREIVERHWGSISAESRPGRTVFTVKLPLRGGEQAS